MCGDGLSVVRCGEVMKSEWPGRVGDSTEYGVPVRQSAQGPKANNGPSQWGPEQPRAWANPASASYACCALVPSPADAATNARAARLSFS